jgi:hypothetical protein
MIFSFLKKRRKIVLDTSIFINPDVRNPFGKTPEEAINEFLNLAKKSLYFDFYMPSSVVKELFYFIDEKRLSRDFYYLIRIKSPDKHRILCPAIFFFMNLLRK